METIHLSLSPDYVSTWKTWEAVREILQNAIDTKDYEITTDKENNYLSITSNGGVLEKSTLLLGNSSKRNDENTIGTYGEGFKLAILVLLREGKKVVIKNGADIWHASFEDHPALKTRCLAITIEENVIEYSDKVVFEINGIGASEFDEIDYKTLPKDHINEAIGTYKGSYFWPKYNQKAKLYVGGLFVCELEEGYELNYNFAPNILTLDRDRNRISSFDLSYEATLLISKSGEVELLAELADNGAKDVSDYVNVTNPGHYYGHNVEIAEKIKDSASAQFLKSHGENAYPINLSWDDKKKRVQTVKAMDSGLVPVAITDGYYKMLSDEVREKSLDKYSEFNLSAEVRQFYEENKNQLRGKPRKKLEKIIEMIDLYEGAKPLPKTTSSAVVKDYDSFGDDLPF